MTLTSLRNLSIGSRKRSSSTEAATANTTPPKHDVLVSALAPPTRLTQPELVSVPVPDTPHAAASCLENVQSALELEGNPHLSHRRIFVGGTNGKGSVSSALSNILTAAFRSQHAGTAREQRGREEPGGGARLPCYL